MTGKLITESISDASAKAYATDLGLLYKPMPRLNVGAVIANVGSKLKFADQSDPLPLAGRLGATYQLRPQWDLSAEAVYRNSGLASGSVGTEWRYGDIFSFRAGYNSSHIKGLEVAAVWIKRRAGEYFSGARNSSYAYVPMGDLGSTNYFSLVFRWDTKPRQERPRLKSAQEERDFEDFNDPTQYKDIYQFLNDDEKKPLQ